MFITNPDIENYIRNLTKVDDEVLLEMEKLGHRLNFPIIDRLVGRFIYLITKIKNPKLIVELGSGFGYSGYWFAKALSNGKVILSDYREENINKAKEFFKRGNLLDKAEFHIGDALEVAKKYKDIDILFIDHEKSRYLEAIKTLENNLSENALVIADNVLWDGKVLEDNTDKQTRKIKEFTEFMFNNSNFETCIVPIRDGVLLARKIWNIFIYMNKY